MQYSEQLNLLAEFGYKPDPNYKTNDVSEELSTLLDTHHADNRGEQYRSSDPAQGTLDFLNYADDTPLK